MIYDFILFPTFFSYLKAENENLREILKDKDARLDDFTQRDNDQEWNLSKHQKCFQDCNDR